MSNRPAGGARSKRHKREPYDWYCDSPREVRHVLLDKRVQLPDRALVYDPSCGRGNILDVCKSLGHATVGSDLFERRCPIKDSYASSRHRFFVGDFLKAKVLPRIPGLHTVIVNNPPYSYREDIAEKFIRKALSLEPDMAIFILPIAFLASQDRWAFFELDLKPCQVAIYSERPSMPPGSTIDKYTTFNGGMADYIAIIYRPPHRWKTELIWLRPGDY